MPSPDSRLRLLGEALASTPEESDTRQDAFISRLKTSSILAANPAKGTVAKGAFDSFVLAGYSLNGWRKFETPLQQMSSETLRTLARPHIDASTFQVPEIIARLSTVVPDRSIAASAAIFANDIEPRLSALIRKPLLDALHDGAYVWGAEPLLRKAVGEGGTEQVHWLANDVAHADRMMGGTFWLVEDFPSQR